MNPPPSSTPAIAATMDELAGHCFACGPRNPEGLHLHFTIDPIAITAHADVQLTDTHAGAPGLIHGGIIATLLDEAGSKLNRPLGLLAMTRHMSVDYLRPAPVDTPLLLASRHLRREGRKLFHEATLTNREGLLLARAELLFIVIPDRLLPAHIRGHINPTEQDLP